MQVLGIYNLRTWRFICKQKLHSH